MISQGFLSISLLHTRFTKGSHENKKLIKIMINVQILLLVLVDTL